MQIRVKSLDVLIIDNKKVTNLMGREHYELLE